MTDPIIRIPENTSFLQGNKFAFTFLTLPFLRYFGQACALPGVSTTAVKVETPFSATYRHGDKLEFQPLIMTAIVDEDIRVWEETYNWIVALTAPSKFSQYFRNDLKSGMKTGYHDGTMILNTNANIPNLEIAFFDCHPTYLSKIDFDYRTEDASKSLTCEIHFQYDRFEIRRPM